MNNKAVKPKKSNENKISLGKGNFILKLKVDNIHFECSINSLIPDVKLALKANQ